MRDGLEENVGVVKEHLPMAVTARLKPDEKMTASSSLISRMVEEAQEDILIAEYVMLTETSIAIQAIEGK